MHVSSGKKYRRESVNSFALEGSLKALTVVSIDANIAFDNTENYI